MMLQEDPKVDGISESERWSDSDCSDDVREFWAIAIDGRINRICRAPPPQQYSSTTTSSIEALGKERQILEKAMDVIRRRCAMEEQALKGALEALREHLECEERIIAQSIARIHHHCNLLVPVMRLPPEILSRIFVFHAQVERNWLNAALTSTHVCKQWWQVGQVCPELWSHINYKDCRSERRMAWMFKRSGALPLSLVIDEGAEVSADKMTLVGNNVHRFRSLDLDVPLRGDFFKAFSQPAPLLQRLTISNYGFSFFAFPPEFLGGSAPNLRYMKLRTSSYIPWDSGLFAHLTTLDVRRSMGNSVENPPSLGMLLSALVRMPGLETLILRRCFPPPTPSTMEDAHVDLSNLKRLEVAASMARCTCFLRQITINTNTIVLLNIGCPSIPGRHITKFFTVFPSHLYTISPPTTQALKFTWDNYGSFTVDVWTAQRRTKVKRSSNASIKLNFSWDWEDSQGVRSPSNLTWMCFTALASPQLRSFRMSGGDIDGWGVGIWCHLARIAPNLQALALGNRALGVRLCRALYPPDGSDRVPADCCFPALSYLELEAPYDHPMPTPGEGESTLSVVLARSFASRALIGCRTPLLLFIVSLGVPPEGWSRPFTDAVPEMRVRVGRQKEEGYM